MRYNDGTSLKIRTYALRAFFGFLGILLFFATIAGGAYLYARSSSENPDTGILGFEVSCPPEAPPPSARQEEASRILAETGEKYATLRFYRDTGVVLTTFINSQRIRTRRRPFSTAFFRPNRFRFEYRDEAGSGAPRRYLISRESGVVQTWWTIKPTIQRGSDLALALGGATGVSGASAHTIPRLLLPEEVKGSSILNLRNLSLREDGLEDGTPCWVISGSSRSGEVKHVWIEMGNGAIRRIIGGKRFKDFCTQDTMIFYPRMDDSIPDEAFAFDPPSDAPAESRTRSVMRTIVSDLFDLFFHP